MAKRLWSYRSGDLKEHLGLVLLGGIGAVAPVSREEDIGMDAIVTLFRPEERLLFAQESFYVQLKSSNINEITFDKDDVEWLRLIALPFFVGLVDGDKAALRLYSTNCLYEFFKIDEQYETIVMRFGEGGTEDGSPEFLTVYLREPVLEWSAGEMFTADFRRLAHRVLSKWLIIEGDNVRLRRTGLYWHANWQTNNPPNVAFKRFAFAHASREEFHQTLRYMEPLLARLMTQMLRHCGVAVEFPEYMIRIYSENGVECELISEIMRSMEQHGDNNETVTHGY